MIEKQEKRAVNLTSDKVPDRRMGEIKWYEHGIFIHYFNLLFPIKKLADNSVCGDGIHLCVCMNEFYLYNRSAPVRFIYSFYHLIV